MPGMPETMRKHFDGIPDPVVNRGMTLSDCLMSGLAVFSFKTPSPLRFDRNTRGGVDPVMARNLRSLFGVERVPQQSPCGHADARASRRCRPAVPSAVLLEDARGLAARRGIGEMDRARRPPSHCGGRHRTPFPETVKCKDRRVKNHQDGTKTCHHQMLGAAIIHPDLREVLPLAPEPIPRDDGATKNDCERNASKRPVSDLRREHPHMKAIVVEDGLASSGPRAETLMENGFRFILGAKPEDHTPPFGRVEAGDTRETRVRRDMKTGAMRRFDRDCNPPTTTGTSISGRTCPSLWKPPNGERRQRSPWSPTCSLTGAP